MATKAVAIEMSYEQHEMLCRSSFDFHTGNVVIFDEGIVRIEVE